MNKHLDHDNSTLQDKESECYTTRVAWSVAHFAIKIAESHNCHGDSGKVEMPLYDYLHDAHIDTALKKVFPEL
jgi:hypothetical protein